jgi:hypothetical protein
MSLACPVAQPSIEFPSIAISSQICTLAAPDKVKLTIIPSDDAYR